MKKYARCPSCRGCYAVRTVLKQSGEPTFVIYQHGAPGRDRCPGMYASVDFLDVYATRDECRRGKHDDRTE